MTSGDLLTIEWRWSRASGLLLVLPTVFWNLLVLTWLVVAVDLMLVFAALGLPALVVGLLLAHHCACQLLNTTTISVERSGSVVVAHGPIPILRRRGQHGGIVQLYRREGRRSTWSSNRRRRADELWALLDGGERRLLLGGIERGPQATFLEREIEQFLGIEQEVVRWTRSMPPPDGVEVIDSGASITIKMSRRYNNLGWSYAAVGLLLIVAAIGMGVGAVRGADVEGAGWIIATIFVVGFSGAGATMVQRGLVSIVNTITVTAIGGSLSIEEGPIPTRGASLSITDPIVQISCQKAARADHLGRHPLIAHDVHVLLGTGERRRILRSVGDEDHASFLTYRMEEFFGLDSGA